MQPEEILKQEEDAKAIVNEAAEQQKRIAEHFQALRCHTRT